MRFLAINIFEHLLSSQSNRKSTLILKTILNDESAYKALL